MQLARMDKRLLTEGDVEGSKGNTARSAESAEGEGLKFEASVVSLVSIERNS